MIYETEIKTETKTEIKPKISIEFVLGYEATSMIEINAIQNNWVKQLSTIEGEVQTMKCQNPEKDHYFAQSRIIAYIDSIESIYQLVDNYRFKVNIVAQDELI